MPVYERIKVSQEYWESLRTVQVDLVDSLAAPIYEVEVSAAADPQDEIEHAEALASILKDRIDEFVEETRERRNADANTDS